MSRRRHGLNPKPRTGQAYPAATWNKLHAGIDSQVLSMYTSRLQRSSLSSPITPVSGGCSSEMSWWFAGPLPLPDMPKPMTLNGWLLSKGEREKLREGPLRSHDARHRLRQTTGRAPWRDAPSLMEVMVRVIQHMGPHVEQWDVYKLQYYSVRSQKHTMTGPHCLESLPLRRASYSSNPCKAGSQRAGFIGG